MTFPFSQRSKKYYHLSLDIRGGEESSLLSSEALNFSRTLVSLFSPCMPSIIPLQCTFVLSFSTSSDQKREREQWVISLL